MWPFRSKITLKKSPQILGWKLNDSVSDYSNLSEISPTLYQIFPKTFENEKIYRGPGLRAFDEEWDIYIAIVGNIIYKINIIIQFLSEQDALSLASKLIGICKTDHGKPHEANAGIVIWDTIEGNLLVQRAWDPFFGHQVSMILTSSIVKQFKLK